MAESEKQSGKSVPKGLKPWKKGESGNPSGRPPAPICIPNILREIGAEVDPETKRTRLQGVMAKVFDYADAGQSWAVQFIAERTEGKVKDTLALEGGGTLEVVTRVVRKESAPSDDHP